jgi:hypothetical protein
MVGDAPLAQDLEARFEVILELLDVLQALPNDLTEVKAVLDRVEHGNELCYAILKEQGWLIKDQQQRLKNLEALA